MEPYCTLITNLHANLQNCMDLSYPVAVSSISMVIAMDDGQV